MVDFLDVLVDDAIKTVESGYYNFRVSGFIKRKVSLKEAITNCKRAPIITEIKPASPSCGSLRVITGIKDLKGIARDMEDGGAIGISVLTEPKHFGGSITNLVEVKRCVNLPVLMKDIIVDPIQIEAAAELGADAILLIYSVFKKGYLDYSVEDLIHLAQSMGLEVLLETHNKEEFLAALETDADLVGINNRDLRTLKVNLYITKEILSNIDGCKKIIVSESGIRRPEDIRFLWSCGAKAFLIGSAIMSAQNIKEKVRELVMAI
ncbi:MAG: indole-3-glycerol-phosphate synthase [Nitrososphaerales archaeon]|nr:indole-3-glycerol-phosphate synthase [Nitrososphaerales archaeon]